MTQARAALVGGEIDLAEQLARQADSLRLPEAAFGPQDDRTWRVLLEVQKGRARQAGVVKAGGAVPAGEAGGQAARYPTTQAVYDPNHDSTRNLITNARSLQSAPDEVLPAEPINRLPSPAVTPSPGEQLISPALRLFQEGEQALRDRDVVKARERFRQAYGLRDQLDAVTAQRLQDHLQLLSGPQAGAHARRSAEKLDGRCDGPASVAGEAVVSRSGPPAINRAQTARDRRQTAADLLQQTRVMIESSGVEPDARTQLLKRLDMSLAEVEKYIKEHRAQIELDAQNKEVRSGVESSRLYKLEIDDRLAKMADDFNRLLDERRFAEAEVVAKRAVEIAPDNPFSRQLLTMVKFAYRNFKNQQTIDNKEDAAWKTFDAVEEAAIPFDDRNPFVFGDVEELAAAFVVAQHRQAAEGRGRRSERELDIERKLRTPVSLKFRNKPLSEVLDELAKLAAINLYLDPLGLQEEGIPSDTPVTIDLSQDITLKSALHLILEPLALELRDQG